MKIKGCKLFTLVNVMALVVSFVILFVTAKYQSFAQWYCNTVSAFLRFVLSAVTGVFQFSVAELLVVVVLPAIVIYTLVKLVQLIFFKRKSVLKQLCVLLNAVMLCGVLFINAFGVCYNRIPLEQSMQLSKKQITKSQLELLCLNFSSALEKDVKKVEFDKGGASKMPYSWNELNKKLDIGYEALLNKYDFLSSCTSNAKRIALSPLMTYTHISGIYMPLTGEANVNTNYPNYVVAYSTAHEKAHQRGIAGEDEANFIAYLACINSGDEYLTYCAHMSMYDYLLSAMLETDRVTYKRLIEACPDEVLCEMYAYSVFFDKYRKSAASKVADNVNDTYLKTLGQEDGVKSYGLVVELMAAYAKEYGI